MMLIHDAQVAMSAISALAARRRGGAAVASPQAASPEPEERPAASNKNSFDLLSKHAKEVATPSPKNKPVVKSRSNRVSNSPVTPQKPEISRYNISSSFPFSSYLNIPSRSEDSYDNLSVDNLAKMVQYSSFRLTKRNHRTMPIGGIMLCLEDSEVGKEPLFRINSL